MRLVEEFDDEHSFDRRPNAAAVEGAVRTLIAATGDDPMRAGLRETPARVAKAYGEWFAGYGVDARELLNRTFDDVAGYDELVLLRSIPVRSTCEHHMAAIIGVAHVGYLPDRKVVGISKLARLVDAYSRRLQIQERLTRQIGETLHEILKPRGVGVIIEASHGCMSTRGVNLHGTSLVTKCWLGDLKSSRELRRDFTETVRHGM